ncbi:MAG: hypothetical protein AAF702_49685 [Chloroflexota bacterium]
MLKKLINDGWIGAAFMLIIAWFVVAIIDAEAIKSSQTPIMPGLKAHGIEAINYVLAAVARAINEAIAAIFPYWQLIALVVLVLISWFGWRWVPVPSTDTATAVGARWNEAKVRKALKSL